MVQKSTKKIVTYQSNLRKFQDLKLLTQSSFRKLKKKKKLLTESPEDPLAPRGPGGPVGPYGSMKNMNI